MDKKPLNTLSEHRGWCPWISVSADDDEKKDDVPGWKLLLRTLLPSMSPDRSYSLLEVSALHSLVCFSFSFSFSFSFFVSFPSIFSHSH